MKKLTIALSIVLASILAFVSVSGFAGQGRGGSGGASADRSQSASQDRAYDRNRTQERVGTEAPDRDQDRTQAQTRVETRAKDQDSLKMQDPMSLRDQDIYGHELMSGAELARYRKKLGYIKTEEAREKYQARHEARMQRRAAKKDKDLVPPGQGPIYGGELMSVQERNEYREQLRRLNSEQERLQFQAQHRDKIQQRAKALGLEVKGS